MKLLVSFFILLASTHSLHAGDTSGSGHGEDKAFRHLLPPKAAQLSKSRIPSKVQLLSPKALSTVSGSTVELSWQASALADSYHVQVATDPNFKWLVHNQHDVRETKLSVSDLPAGQIFWRVAPQKSQNMAGHWKGVFNFSSFEVTKN